MGRGAGCKFDTTSLAWGESSRDWQLAWPSIGKPDDKHGNENGGIPQKSKRSTKRLNIQSVRFVLFRLTRIIRVLCLVRYEKETG